MQLLRQRDQHAFGYLYDHYAGALMGVVQQIVLQEVQQQDVLQEVFVHIWRRIETYDAGKGRLFTWMLHIARNAAIDRVRSKDHRHALLHQPLPAQESLVAGQAPLADYGLKRLLQKLSDEHQQLIHLSYYQGYTHEQIAKALDMPLGTVKTRLRAALLQLRNLMK